MRWCEQRLVEADAVDILSKCKLTFRNDDHRIGVEVVTQVLAWLSVGGAGRVEWWVGARVVLSSER